LGELRSSSPKPAIAEVDYDSGDGPKVARAD